MRRGKLRRPFLAAVAATALAAAPADAWDSRNFPNVTHATHSYLTEFAIDQLAARHPELRVYAGAIIDGANTELHELPVTGVMYGVDLDAGRIAHQGTNEGTADIAGWWADALAAYRSGNREQAYFYVGIMLHMVEDMGVPAHAHGIHHQGNLTEFDNFEMMGLLNWRPDFAGVNRSDPGYSQPWRYYAFSQEWTLADAPDYRDTDTFATTWLTASDAERALLANRQARTAMVAMWTLQSALRAFAP
ncbi:MAG: hypothetical protein ACWA6X_02990 [Bauldia sp.]